MKIGIIQFHEKTFCQQNFPFFLFFRIFLRGAGRRRGIVVVVVGFFSSFFREINLNDKFQFNYFLRKFRKKKDAGNYDCFFLEIEISSIEVEIIRKFHQKILNFFLCFFLAI